MIELLSLTQGEYTKFGIGETGFFNATEYSAKNKTMVRARIDNIDENGIVTLKFQYPIYRLSNLTLIDGHVL